MENLIFPESRGALRQWFETHGGTAQEVWVPCSPKGGGRELVYLDCVEEALCYGWIDSGCRRAEGVCCRRFSPRRPGGLWTELNKERCRRLIKLGLMTEAGRRVLPPLGEPFVPAPWIEEALRADPEVWVRMGELPPLYVRVRLYNIGFEAAEGRRDSALRRLDKFMVATRAGRLYGEWNDSGRLLDY